MSVTAEWLAQRLLAEGEKVELFFDGLALDRWEVVIYSEGARWKIRQVLAHLVASERSMQRLVENVRSGGPGSPADFDLDGYNQRKVSELEAASPGDLLENYRIGRQTSADLVRGLTEDDLMRTGRHPWLGVASLEEIVKMMYRHNQIHLREIRKIIDLASEA